jgi:short-subunit dehydrogenase
MRIHAGRTALITGGTSGIGLAIAFALADEGYALTVCSRRESSVGRAGALLRDHGATVHPIVADLSSDDAAHFVVAEHAARYGRLDVLVQSAGIGFYGDMVEHGNRSLDLEIQLNYRSPFCTMRSALPLLQAAGAEHRKALVVNIASFSGAVPMAKLASYSATKAALIALGRAAQAEVGDLGIQITALCPGYVDTHMSDFWSDNVAKTDMLSANDLAEAVRFLLRTSPACRVPEIILGRGRGVL